MKYNKDIAIKPTKIRRVLHWLNSHCWPVAIYLYLFLFVYTSSDKLAHVERFSRGIKKVPFLGSFAPAIGRGVPLLEIAIALLLLFPNGRRLGLKLATGLMVLFTLYLGLMMLFVEARLCHCGGVIEKLGWGQHLVLNLVFILLGCWALRTHSTYLKN